MDHTKIVTPVNTENTKFVKDAKSQRPYDQRMADYEAVYRRKARFRDWTGLVGFLCVPAGFYVSSGLHGVQAYALGLGVAAFVGWAGWRERQYCKQLDRIAKEKGF